MEIVSKLRWLIVVFVLLFVLVFVGWGLSAIARNVFNRSDTPAVTTDDTATEAIEDVSSARYIVDGPVVASREHRRYVIEVDRSDVRFTLYSDYGQRVITSRTYRNNDVAFDSFIASLEGANAAARYSGTDTEDDNNDQGVCPQGRRYIVELDDDIRRWTTSCDRSQGTAAGKMTTMRTLFSRQVPDFRELLEDTGLTLR